MKVKGKGRIKGSVALIETRDWVRCPWGAFYMNG